VSDRYAAAYERVADEVEKLVSVVRDSQEQQQKFLEEACRLLHEQGAEVEAWREKVVSQSELMAKLEEIAQLMGKGNVQVQVSTTDVPVDLLDDQRPQVKETAVRFLHASPDAPNVSIFVDGRKVASDVEFQGVSPYLPLAPGPHRVQVFPFGVSTAPIIDTTLDVKKNTHYTVVAAGYAREIQPLVVRDAPRGAKPGFARLKVVHLSPNAPAVDVTLPNGKVLLGHLTFREVSQYLQVTPGVRDLQVRSAGQQNVVLDLKATRFDPNVTYTVYVTGNVNGEPALAPLLLPEA